MPLPSNVTTWADAMDPRDIQNFKIDCSTFLDDGENVNTYTLSLMSDAVLAGLNIGTGAYAPSIAANKINIWFNITDANQQDEMFYGGGTNLPLVIEVVTTSIPARRRERTFAVKVQQQ